VQLVQLNHAVQLQVEMEVIPHFQRLRPQVVAEEVKFHQQVILEVQVEVDIVQAVEVQEIPLQ
jgi:hypothetical protein